MVWFQMISNGARLMTAGFVLMAAVQGHPNAAQEQASVEYKIKAAYILNFTKFIEWPAQAFPAPETPMTLCILGKDPFGSDLEQTIGNKLASGRPLRIRRMEELKTHEECHVLFISASERRRLPQILQALGRHSVLTIGEMDGFTQQGGMINFVKQENTIRFEINDDAAAKAGLQISSKLLRIGKAREEKGP